MSAGTSAASANAPPSSAAPIAKRSMPGRAAPQIEAGVGKSSIARPADRPTIKQRSSARVRLCKGPAGLNLLHNPGAERLTGAKIGACGCVTQRSFELPGSPGRARPAKSPSLQRGALGWRSSSIAWLAVGRRPRARRRGRPARHSLRICRAG
jgi:hypothetical protein